jgi:hypothetical protein
MVVAAIAPAVELVLGAKTNKTDKLSGEHPRCCGVAIFAAY